MDGIPGSLQSFALYPAIASGVSAGDLASASASSTDVAQNASKIVPEGTCKTVSVLHVPSGSRNGADLEPKGSNIMHAFIDSV